MTVASRETAVLCLCCSRGILEAGVPETRGLQVLAAGDKGIHCSDGDRLPPTARSRTACSSHFQVALEPQLHKPKQR